VIDVPAAEGLNGPDDLISLQGDDAMLGLLESPKAADLDVIRLRLGELPEAVDQVEEILLDQSDRFSIFQRAGELVRAVSLPEPRKGGGLQRCEGTVQLEPLGGVALTEIFSRIARWERIDSKGDIQTVDCPPKIAAFYMSRMGSWRLRVLMGVISAPVLREDGTVLSQPGYDSESGLLFVSNEDWSDIPDQPTRDDAKAALEILRAPFEEFPFVSEEDRAVHIAAILTAIQRRTLEACPIFGYSAPAPRSGKSLLSESVAIIATGKPVPATAVSGEHEEMRKAIAAALREGHSIINLDNIEVPLSSPDLARALTQSEYQDRLLGESRMLRLPTNVLWTATGNKLVFRGDLACRALMCRIDSGLERPEARTFKIPHLVGSLKANRKQFVAAALTILRAFHLARRPSQHLSAWGGFDNWSASVREPLVWAGMADPCRTREFVMEDDPEREEWLAGVQCLYKGFAGGEFTTKTIIERCGSDEALRASMLSVAAGRQQKQELDSRRLGWWLRRVRDRIIGGLRLCRSGKASGVAHWRVEEVRAGGHEGHSGHFPATENTTKSENGSNGGWNDAEQKNDPYDHHDHRNGEDEIVI
jgi:putative DNA primase/helicase